MGYTISKKLSPLGRFFLFCEKGDVYFAKEQQVNYLYTTAQRLGVEIKVDKMIGIYKDDTVERFFKVTVINNPPLRDGEGDLSNTKQKQS